MNSPRPLRLLLNGLALLSLSVLALSLLPAAAAAASPALGFARVVASGAGATAPRVRWLVHRRTEIRGVTKGKTCKVDVSGDEKLADLDVRVVGKRGAAKLLPRDRRLLDQRSIERGSFSCAVDTRSLPNGPIEVKATAVGVSGESHTATQEFIVNNTPSTATATPSPGASTIGSQATGTSGGSAQWFSSSSFWNRSFDGESALAPKSSAYVSELVRQVNSAGPWMNYDRFSAPVYTVGPEQATTKVTLKTTSGSTEPQLQSAFNAVPIPANAVPAAGTDEHLVVWQPSTNKMWEFWELHKEGSGWVAAWGGAMQNVSENPGYYTESSWPGAKTYWGATATSLPLVGGLLTIKEMQEGHIDHAIAMAIPEPSPEAVWPAQRSDGFDRSPDAIPEGTIFRLPASLEISKLGLPSFDRMLAEAAQEYGIVVRDTSGCVCFYGEDPTPDNAISSYGRILEGEYPNNLMKKFPWGSLEAVKPGT